MSRATESRWGYWVTRGSQLIFPLVKRSPRLLDKLRTIRARLPMPRDTLQGQFMQAFGSAYPRAVFIQVGANDGAIYDPIRRQILGRSWRGIMLEPVPDIFARLAHNYRFRPQLILENAAISAQDGERDFYSLRPVADPKAEGLPPWYMGLGSFYKDVILSHRQLIPDIDERLVTQKVPCLTFKSLCRKHGISAVNMIQIDTEGYDYEVIKLIDFSALKPELVVYEHHHLSPEDRRACEALLQSHGYTTTTHRLDTLALHLPSIPAKHRGLLKAWQDLQANAAAGNKPQ